VGIKPIGIDNDIESTESNWPSEAEEASFLSRSSGNAEEIQTQAHDLPVMPQEVEEVNNEPMPSLQELINRIPAPLRDSLEELFRARYNRVTRIKDTKKTDSI
jgi:hypothetical protein